MSGHPVLPPDPITLPLLDGVAQVVIDEHIIEENAKPLLVYREQAKASA